jgi:hypothetical protein
MAQESWNKQLKEWMELHPREASTIKERIPNTTLANWLKEGSKLNLTKINIGTRAFLYKTTGLEVLKFDGYVDPESIDPRKIVSGEQPRAYTDIYLGYQGLNRTKLAEDSGVHGDTALKFVRGQSIRSEQLNLINAQLLKYHNTYSSQQTVQQEAPQPQQRETRIVQSSPEAKVPAGSLDRIAQGVESLLGEVRRLGASYTPTSEQRKQIIIGAVDTLVEQLDYYRTASQADREELAKYLEVDRWGWVLNVLGGIAKKESPETFARHMSPPEKTRRRDK